MTFKLVLRTLYVVSIGIIVLIALAGLPYYLTSVSERPHSELHADFKPGGLWGHGLGIIGSSMIIIMLSYSLRKRRKFGLKKGPLNKWLSIHIYLGVIGPLLITLHTAMKFGGIVSISFFSMVAVVLSGVFGRYIYMQIPRDSRGHALTLEKSQARLDAIEARLRDEHDMPDDVLVRIRKIANQGVREDMGAMRAIMSTSWHAITVRFRVGKLKRYIKARRRNIPAATLSEIVRLAKEQSMLKRKVSFLDSMNNALHYWHVFHKPFAYLMLIIMVLHVVVTVSFGYRWIW